MIDLVAYIILGILMAPMAIAAMVGIGFILLGVYGIIIVIIKAVLLIK